VENKLINYSCVYGGIVLLVTLTQQDADIKNIGIRFFEVVYREFNIDYSE
jgi:hypothetical protein